MRISCLALLLLVACPVEKLPVAPAASDAGELAPLEAAPHPQPALIQETTRQPGGDCPPRPPVDCSRPGACVPSCSCANGAWVCTPDCGGCGVQAPAMRYRLVVDYPQGLRLGADGKSWEPNGVPEIEAALEAGIRTEHPEMSGVRPRWLRAYYLSNMDPEEIARLIKKLKAVARSKGPQVVQIRENAPLD